MASAAVQLASLGAAVEVFAWSERNAHTAAARALRRPGHELQRVLGTREPTEEQLEVGRAALAEILRVEAEPASPDQEVAAVAGRPACPFGWDPALDIQRFSAARLRHRLPCDPSRPTALCSVMPPTSPAHPRHAAGTALRLLLVEDDEGDAFLVSELLREEDAPFDVLRVRTLAEALELLSAEPVDCVLLDLGLPDASGLAALQRCARRVPNVAHLVLTGDRDVQRGVEAVAAGAQDYLVKGSVDGDGLRRAVLYAVERRQADDVRQQLRGAELLAEEARRLERGLLPKPILHDERLGVGTGYRPGRQRTLLGGDFYDAVELPDGRVHLLIGDVSGHGPDEAALGVCLRVAWRTQTLGDARHRRRPAHAAARARPRAPAPTRCFATVLTVCVRADRAAATLRSAGHQPPAAAARATARRRSSACAPGLPLGIFDDASWPARESRCPERWGLLLSTDGLIEGRAGPGAQRAPGHGRAARRCSPRLGDGAGPRTRTRSSPSSSRRSCAATARRRSTTSPPCC